ncbi:MAG: HAD family hydrolase [Candidatus Hermodarchaeota archaeon]
MKIIFDNKKIIVFDLDGTIVNLTADWIALKDVLIKKYKQIYNDNCDFKRISKCLDSIVKKNDEQVLENFFDIIRHYELENIKETQPINETIFFIKNKELFGVKKETKFAVLSLNTRISVIRALEIANIAKKIDFIVGREDVRKWKPAPDGLLKIEDHYGVKKEQVIYFGDLESDILTGKNAGIESYFIDDLINLVRKKLVN